MPASSVAVAVIIVVVPLPVGDIKSSIRQVPVKSLCRILFLGFISIYSWPSAQTEQRTPFADYLSFSLSLSLAHSVALLLACLLGSCSAFACAYFECAHFDHVIEIFTFKTWPKYICFCMYVFRSPLVTSNGAFSPFNLQWNLFNTLLQWCVPSRPRPALSSGCGRLLLLLFYAASSRL